MIVGVEKASVGQHPRHLPALVNDREASILVNLFDLHMLLKVIQQLVLVMEVMDELLRRNSVGDDF